MLLTSTKYMYTNMQTQLSLKEKETNKKLFSPALKINVNYSFVLHSKNKKIISCDFEISVYCYIYKHSN